MDEKQLQLLFDHYGKSNGFADYNEFKTLMSNDNSRKVFFDNANKDLGFKDYNEFNTILKVKPVSPFTNSIQNQFKQATTVTKQPEIAVSETVVDKNKGNDQFLEGFGTEVKPKSPVNKSGTPIGVSVNKDKSKDGSVLGGIYNTLVGSVSRFAGGILEAGNSLTKAVVPLVVEGSGENGKLTETEKSAFDAMIETQQGSREDVTALIEKARSGSSTKEQEQARSDFNLMDKSLSADDVKAMLFQAPAQVLDMAMGAFSGGSSFFVQSVNDNAKQLDSNPSALKLSEGEKLGYLFTQAAVQAALEKFAIDKILKSTGVSKKLTQKISAEITDEFVKRGIKATAKDIEEAAIKKATQLSSKIKSGGIKTLTGIATEGATEGVQSAASDGVKLLTNKISGKEVFNEEDIRNNFIKNVINSTVQGAAFGGIFGGLGATLTNTNKAIRKQISEVQSPEDLQKLATDINEQVEAGNITEEEANAANIKAQQYVEIASKIPKELDSETKYAIIGGIEQREGLAAEIEKENSEMANVDPVFHSAKKAKIELLQAKLDQTNDYIESIVTGEEPKYKKGKDGEFLKVTPEGEEIPISKPHYELATAIKENKKIKESEVPEIEKPKESKVTVIMPENKEAPIEIKKLEQERDIEIEKAVKPDFKMDFIDNTDIGLAKQTGKERIKVTKKGKTITAPETYRDLQNDLRKRRASLEALINCV